MNCVDIKKKIILGVAVATLGSSPLLSSGVSVRKTETHTITPIVARAETSATLQDAGSDSVIWVNKVEPANSLILGAVKAGGIEIYGLDGSRTGVMSGRPIDLLDVRYNFPLAGKQIDLIVAYDPAAAGLVAYTVDVGKTTLREVSAGTIGTGTGVEIEDICMYQSPLSGKFYVFAVGEGIIQQWQLFDQADRVAARQIRTIPVGLGAAHCATHDRESVLYFSQETVGVWALDAEPESKGEKEPVDFIKPFGRFVGDVKSVATYELAEKQGYLLVSDSDTGIQVYDLRTHTHIGTVGISAGRSIDAVEDTESLVASSLPLSETYAGGLLVFADEDNEGEHANYKIVAWTDIASSLGLGSYPGFDPTADVLPRATIVLASVETVPVKSVGDAADDPAIWVHPEKPERSLIIGTQKKRGINVYDLSGNLLQSRPDGRINNVDLRYGFSLGDKSVDIVTASNRSTDSISIYMVDPSTRTLVDIADGLIPTGMTDPYGQCMYRSATSGQYFVFINNKDGLMRQWVLEDNGGRVGARLVREFTLGSQIEGCVADDETGDLYVGEENVGFWKYSAEPEGGETRTLVDSVGETGNLTADVEGIAIYYGPDGKGYLIVSNQGADNYAVYERFGDNRFLGLFHVAAGEATDVDGVSETDGLDVTGANLGTAFPHGVFVAQDGRNITPSENQNYKLVPWERIAEAMELKVFSGYDPRTADAK